MRQYHKQEMREVNKIICNKCGKEIVVERGVPKQDVFSVEKRWGYFSGKDNEVHSFDICEACYDEWIAAFSIPVDTENS
ncbi:MAG: hypothetical protein IJZ53_13040 [Tyzzerella sp.]|nr:hypothetical protein [Tyzzerella sp.]